jgi:hypothetical protein
MPQAESVSASLDQNGDTRTYCDSEHYDETRSYSGSRSYDGAYSSSYSSSDSRNDQDQDDRDDDHYDHEMPKNDRAVAEKTSINNSRKLNINTSSPSTPSSLLSSPFGEQVFGFMKDAFNKLVEGRDALGKLAGGTALSTDKKVADKQNWTKSDETRDLEEASLGSNISYLESSSKSYSDDGLSIDETTMTSERGGASRAKSPHTAPNRATEIDNNNLQAALTDDSPAGVRYAVSATSSEYPSFDRYHCPSNPTATLDSATFSKDNIELPENGDDYVDSMKESRFHLSADSRGMETIDEDYNSDDTNDAKKSLKVGREEFADSFDSKFESRLNGNDKYQTLSDNVPGSDGVNDFHNFSDKVRDKSSQSSSKPSDVDPSHGSMIMEDITTKEPNDHYEKKTDNDEEPMSGSGSKENAEKETEDEFQIQMVKFDGMDVSEMNRDQDTMNNESGAEILLIQDNDGDDEDGDSGKFTLSQESALVFSASSSDSEMSYRRYQAVSDVIPIRNSNVEPFRVQIHTEEFIQSDYSHHEGDSTPKQNEVDLVKSHQQTIELLQESETNNDMNYTAEVDSGDDTDTGINRDNEVLESILQEEEDADDKELNSLEFQARSVISSESVENRIEEVNDESKLGNILANERDTYECDDVCDDPKHEEKVVEENLTQAAGMTFEIKEVDCGDNNGSTEMEATTQLLDSQHEVCHEIRDQATNEEIFIEGQNMIDRASRGESKEDIRYSEIHPSDTTQNTFDDVRLENIGKSNKNNMDNRQSPENVDNEEPLTENAASEEALMENVYIEEAVMENVFIEEALTDNVNCEEALTENVYTEEAVTENVDSEEAVTENKDSEEALTGNLDSEEAAMKNLDSEEVVTENVYIEEVVTEDDRRSKDVNQGSPMRGTGLQKDYNQEKIGDYECIHKEPEDGCEEVLLETVEEKLNKLLSNITTLRDKRLVEASYTVVQNEAERHHQFFSLSKNISPWWISDRQINDIAESIKVQSVSTKKASWYLEQSTRSEILLQNRIVEYGAPLKKVGMEQRRTNTRVYWWPVPEDRETSKDAALSKNRKWYTEALESLLGTEAPTATMGTKESRPHPMERRRSLSATNRSWLIASDGKDKILEAMEENQSVTTTQWNKENKESNQLTENPSTVASESHTPQSTETAVAKLKNNIAVTLGSLDNKQRSAAQVSFKNPVLTILKRQSVDSELILMRNTQQRVDFVPSYQPPTPQLIDLIEGIRSDSATRRSNASGTVKLMASQKKNVIMLASAQGLLDALLFAAKLECEGYDAEANAVTKNRSLTTIALLSQAQENRRLICEHSNLVDVLFEILRTDDKDGRLHSCSCFAALAKTEDNRDILAEKEGLISELANILLKLKETHALNKIENGTDADTVSTSRRIASATRLNACAAILHLSKQCNISVSEQVRIF